MNFVERVVYQQNFSIPIQNGKTKKSTVGFFPISQKINEIISARNYFTRFTFVTRNFIFNIYK